MDALIISGPSGVGKGTLITALLGRVKDARLAVSATTRPPRPGERDGEHYHFLSAEQFKAALDRGEFLEHAHYAEHYYGTPVSELRPGELTIIECEVRGAAQLKSRLPQAVSVFLVPPSLDVLGARLRGRGTESEAQVRRRLERAQEELALAGSYDHVLVSGELTDTVAALLALLG